MSHGNSPSFATDMPVLQQMRVGLGRTVDCRDVNRSLSHSGKAILMGAFATNERTGVS